MERIHMNIRVFGHVQGVGFRYTAIRIARGYGIKGFVKNENDGSVYIEAEADNQQLEKFKEWCKRGPSDANVSRIEIEYSPVRNCIGFDVRY